MSDPERLKELQERIAKAKAQLKEFEREEHLDAQREARILARRQQRLKQIQRRTSVLASPPLPTCPFLYTIEQHLLCAGRSALGLRYRQTCPSQARSAAQPQEGHKQHE